MLIYNLAEPQELLGFVRNVQRERDENRFMLSRFLPNQDIDDLTWRANQGELVDEDAAMVRAWDTESPIGSRQGVSRIRGELPPISKKYKLGEEERLRRRSLERGTDQGIVDAIYDDAAKGARSVGGRIELFRGEAIDKGSITINENGVRQTVPFGRASEHSVSAGTVWSNPAALAINDELAWTTVYEGTNGVMPGLALVSRAILNNLALNTQYRSMAAFNGITPPFLSTDQINAVRGQYGLPPLFVYEGKVRVNGVATRVIREDRLIYLPPAGEPLGRTFSGTTAEALELAEARQIAMDDIPGLTSVVYKTADPVGIWTNTSAIALPVLINPNLTLVADVQ
jgi:hypothetical protein